MTLSLGMRMYVYWNEKPHCCRNPRFYDQDVDITPGMTISNAGQGTLSAITGSPQVGGTILPVIFIDRWYGSTLNITYQWQVASNNVWTDLTNTGSDLEICTLGGTKISHLELK